jgi:hypothetical protein
MARSWRGRRAAAAPAAAQPAGPPPARTENVAFANSLLETEIAQRNARKDAQENTARGVIVTVGLVLTLLVGLANDAGLFTAGTSIVARIALVGTVLAAAGSATCAVGTLWPRAYDRLGRKGLVMFNNTEFLDLPAHEVAGRVVATRIGIATTMDEQHENKARWLKWSFRLLVAAFAGLVLQGATLAIDPPPAKPSAPVRILIDRPPNR